MSYLFYRQLGRFALLGSVGGRHVFLLFLLLLFFLFLGQLEHIFLAERTFVASLQPLLNAIPMKDMCISLARHSNHLVLFLHLLAANGALKAFNIFDVFDVKHQNVEFVIYSVLWVIGGKVLERVFL